MAQTIRASVSALISELVSIPVLIREGEKFNTLQDKISPLKPVDNYLAASIPRVFLSVYLIHDCVCTFTPTVCSVQTLILDSCIVTLLPYPSQYFAHVR